MISIRSNNNKPILLLSAAQKSKNLLVGFEITPKELYKVLSKDVWPELRKGGKTKTLPVKWLLLTKNKSRKFPFLVITDELDKTKFQKVQIFIFIFLLFCG